METIHDVVALDKAREQFSNFPVSDLIEWAHRKTLSLVSSDAPDTIDVKRAYAMTFMELAFERLAGAPMTARLDVGRAVRAAPGSPE